MRLSELTGEMESKRLMPEAVMPLSESNPDITSIHYRSQTVLPGGLFVAMAGMSADGHRYIDDAIARGAAAILSEKVEAKAVPVVAVNDARKALGMAASRFYGHPSQRLCIIAVTGTNGKTTTTYIIERILQQAGFEVGVIGTISCRYKNHQAESRMTTPESLDLQQVLAEMADSGVTHVIMEVSSHALYFNRVSGCLFDVGVFTNLSRDHLDFHHDMTSYWACKKRLFTEVLPNGEKKDRAAAVINCDDERGGALFTEIPYRKIGVGLTKKADVGLSSFQTDGNGITGRIMTPEGDMAFQSKLVGRYNAQNILCAAGAAMALCIPLPVISAGISAASSVPGRLERVQSDNNRNVYVDYAHTPDALDNVLRGLSSLKIDKMITVFGCGGDRDRGKRPRMGEIAAKWSDLIIVTTDNPRSENPLSIIKEIEMGIAEIPRLRTGDMVRLEENLKGYLVEPDRKEAIRRAIHLAGPDDIVIIAGKGHETYQIIGGRTFDFDDRAVAAEILKEIQ